MNDDLRDIDPELPDACRASRALLARFVGKSLVHVEHQAFRQHVTHCPECRAIYRETITHAAALGRSFREERADSERTKRRVDARERVFQATGGPRRRNRFGLRLALLPAGIALLILIARGTGSSDGFELRWEAGRVRAAGLMLGADRPTVRLEPGDWCETGEGSRATISVEPGDGSQPFELAGDTQVLVVDPATRAVRLERGRLDAVGPTVITTAHGILSIDEGSATIRITRDGYEIACAGGTIDWIGPTGSRTLERGEHVESSVLADADAREEEGARVPR